MFVIVFVHAWEWVGRRVDYGAPHSLSIHCTLMDKVCVPAHVYVEIVKIYPHPSPMCANGIAIFKYHEIFCFH